MPKSKRQRRDGAYAQLQKIGRYFRDELKSRAWGRDEYAKLVAASTKAREPIDPHEARMTEYILAALDRVTSIQIAAHACVEIVTDDAAGATLIRPRPFRDVLGVLVDQARRAALDAHAALLVMGRPVTRFEARLRPLPLREAAAALARLELSPGDLPHSDTNRRSATSVELALRDVERTVGFLVNSIAVVDRLVAAQDRLGLDRVAVCDLSRFVANAAGLAREVVTERLPNAIEWKASRKSKDG